MTAKKMYVGGKWVASQSGETRSILNPFDGTELAQVAEGGAHDAFAAIESAREAFDQGPWPRTPADERADFLNRLADSIETHQEELAALETMDTGKTLVESRWDMDDVAGVFRYYADLATQTKNESLQAPQENASSTLVQEPVGVCGQILPWNYPLLQASWKLAPALATGCTVVMKPSEITPLTTLRLAELAEEIHFPKGVINTILGPGPRVGAALAKSEKVDLISFTGGVQTGKAVMAAASHNVKRVALELGGKNPNIVFADADFHVAVDQAMNAVFFHAGQICSAGTRLMLHTDIHDAFVEALMDRMAGIRMGNGLDEKTQMGPLISKEHREKVERHVQAAPQDGAVLRMGGKRPTSPELQDGYFFEPTLFTGCHDGMAIVREEVFGPVISVERFEDEDEVIRRANDTIYGLSAGVWTNDEDRMTRMSRALRFGTVWINDYNVYFAQAPWGGFKQSGIGRELGRAGLHEYLETKHVYRNHRPQKVGFFGDAS